MDALRYANAANWKPTCGWPSREGQFEVHYQPLLDPPPAASGVHGGAGPLASSGPRTHSAPLDFIPIAEDTQPDQIPIGEMGAPSRACRDAAQWPEDVQGGRQSLSPAQFKPRRPWSPSPSTRWSRQVSRPNGSSWKLPDRCCFTTSNGSARCWNRLDSLGVEIALDDFGTGYSSLSYLRRFPFTKIKIDHSFVADMAETTDALAIVQATIQLSEKLGLQTTAEGVETLEQLDMLVNEGCTQVQGYHVQPAGPGVGGARLDRSVRARRSAAGDI